MTSRSRDERTETYCRESARALADRLVDAEDALKEARADSEYFEEWATANGKRLNATLAQRDEYRDVLSEVATYDEWEISAVGQSEPVRFVVTDVRPHADAERDRYCLAWLSARRRAKWAWSSANSELRFTRNMWRDALRDLNRYRLAWLSARRRAADEANFGMEALDLKAAEIVRLTADRDAWQRGHETAESQLVYERRENARLRAELADLREAIHEES
jgi:hypothetical protein